ncbi:MAG: anti-sigma factor domain-containing protein [Thermoleophilaceae bacterium]|jgi:anti-sigma-K factor RskA
MSATQDHERHQYDAGAYLLGALTELEAQAFERHMESCTTCHADVERLRMAADALPRSVEQLDPAPSLKRSLMRTVREETEEEPGPGLIARLRTLFDGVSPQLAWVSAAFLLFIGVLGGYAIKAATTNDNGGRTVAAQVDRTRVPQGSASLVVPDGEKNAILRVNGLPEPAANRVYEVWLLRGKQPMPVSIFNVTREGSGAAAIPEDLHDGDQVLVTRERAGGAKAPTEQPVIAVKV